MPRMRADERRRQILEVAADLFATRGFQRTTTSSLAEAAGVTEPVLYRHFRSKLDLFVQLVEEVGREVLATWRAELDRAPDPRSRLRVLLAGNPATHQRGRGIYRVIFQAMTDVEVDPAVARAIGAHVSELHAFVRGEIESLQQVGCVRRGEPASAVAWLLVSVAVGYGLVSPLDLERSGGLSRRSLQGLIHELLSP